MRGGAAASKYKWKRCRPGALPRENMRLPLGFLLVLALSLDQARALWCHRCKGFGGCLQQSRCLRGSDHCVTIATRAPVSLQDLPLVTKMCYSGCPNASSLGLGPHVSIYCCQAHFCNKD